LSFLFFLYFGILFQTFSSSLSLIPVEMWKKLIKG
jgi:hypothetical protein